MWWKILCGLHQSLNQEKKYIYPRQRQAKSSGKRGKIGTPPYATNLKRKAQPLSGEREEREWGRHSFRRVVVLKGSEIRENIAVGARGRHWATPSPPTVVFLSSFWSTSHHDNDQSAQRGRKAKLEGKKGKQAACSAAAFCSLIIEPRFFLSYRLTGCVPARSYHPASIISFRLLCADLPVLLEWGYLSPLDYDSRWVVRAPKTEQ